jgi:hypothetical protein
MLELLFSVLDKNYGRSSFRDFSYDIGVSFS